MKTENDMNGYNVREVLKVKDMKDDATWWISTQFARVKK